jgi:hypothetical protein
MDKYDVYGFTDSSENEKDSDVPENVTDSAVNYCEILDGTDICSTEPHDISTPVTDRPMQPAL